MRKIFAFVFCSISTIFALPIYSQIISPGWTKKIFGSNLNIHLVQENLYVSGVEELLFTPCIQSFSISGDSISKVKISGISSVLQSYYSTDQECFYMAGSNDGLDSIVLAKFDVSGNLNWRKAFKFDDYPINGAYCISELNNTLLISFTLLGFQGESGIGYLTSDFNGNLKSVSILNFPPAATPSISYKSSFDYDGNIVLTKSNASGTCAVYKFDGETNDTLWSRSFNLVANQNDIQSLFIDSLNNIFFSGYDGYLIKLSPSGETLCQVPLGDMNFISGLKLIPRNDYIYVLGDFRENESNLKSKIFIAKFKVVDCAMQWNWFYEHIGNDPGPSAFDGVLKNDTTLYVLFWHLAESDWIGEFKISKTVSNKEPDIEHNILIFPNPTISGEINIDTGYEFGSLQIFDISGRLLSELYVNSKITYKCPMPGAYFIKFITGHNFIVKKIFYAN